MHDTAYALGSRFLELYSPPGDFLAVEIGAQDVNGTLRTALPSRASYIGIDIEAGRNVDVVATGAVLPLASGIADIVLASSVFEHDPTFWRTFCELCRITKPGGYIYVSAPSNGVVHRFPQDCWRFYPDAGAALANWAQRSDLPVTLVESFIADQGRELWNDFVAVFVRGAPPDPHPTVFAHTGFSARNIRRLGTDALIEPRALVEDQDLIAAAARALSALERRAAALISGDGIVVPSGAHERVMRELSRDSDPGHYGDGDFTDEKPGNPFAESHAIIGSALAALAAQRDSLRAAAAAVGKPTTRLDRFLSRRTRSMPWLTRIPGYNALRRASHKLRDAFR